MRRALDRLYWLAGFLAAVAMLTIAALILIQVTLRFFGSQIKSADDIAGWALVATIILGLAPAYRHNSHIRVTLLIDRFALGTSVRRQIERAVTALSVLLAGWATYVAALFVWESYIYNELNQGLLAAPMWIPQFFMAFGFLVFFVALLDDLIVDLRGGTQSHLEAAATGDEMPVER
jgi:TRAP-type C4-dicarboxylate transport system permease small subunit